MERVAPRLEQVSEHLWVVLLEGEYDLANVDQVDEALDKAFNASSTVILDLQEVTFIDSMVMAAKPKPPLRPRTAAGRNELPAAARRNPHTDAGLTAARNTTPTC